MKIISCAVLLVTFLNTNFAMAGVDSGFPGKGKVYHAYYLPKAEFRSFIINAVTTEEPLTLKELPDEELEAIRINIKNRSVELRSLRDSEICIILKEAGQ